MSEHDGTRLSTIKLSDLGQLGRKQTNPYAEEFSVEAAEKTVVARLEVFEEYLVAAGEQECDLVGLQSCTCG